LLYSSPGDFGQKTVIAAARTFSRDREGLRISSWVDGGLTAKKLANPLPEEKQKI
jgi:hypothetical protein